MPTRHHRTVPKGHCRWCGGVIDKALHPRARTWHPDCVEAYQRQSPGWQRWALWDRDHGRCAACGLRSEDLISRIRGQAYWIGLKYMRVPGIPTPFGARQAINASRYVGSMGHRWRKYLGKTPDQGWHADHVVPLWAGGENDIRNMQTLCETCHKAKTAREAGERARARRDAESRQLSIGDETEQVVERFGGHQ